MDQDVVAVVKSESDKPVEVTMSRLPEEADMVVVKENRAEDVRVYDMGIAIEDVGADPGEVVDPPEGL